LQDLVAFFLNKDFNIGKLFFLHLTSLNTLQILAVWLVIWFFLCRFAAMKKRSIILGLMMLLALVACNQVVKIPEPAVAE
jgi:hypothetical protein